MRPLQFSSSQLTFQRGKSDSDIGDDRLIGAHRHMIAHMKLATALGDDAVIHHHFTCLDAHLGLTTRTDPAFPFQELIKAHREKNEKDH